MKTTLTLILTLALTLIACTQKTPTQQPQQSPKIVNLGIWSNYISPETLQEFEKKTQIKVNVSNYSSNEELLAKIQAGASGYDLVVPSDYMVTVMSKLNLLKKLDSSKLSNSKHLDPRFLKKPFDPQNEYSLPYDWGTTGIAVNRELYKGEIKGWRDLFEKPDLAGKISLLDDTHETLGAALKAQGLSLNTKNPEDINKAKALLLKARSRVKAFTSETLNALVNGEVAVAHAYVSDAMNARKATQGKIDYIFPEEGGTLWIDNLVIPAAAPHPEEAYVLMNFLLDPTTVAKTVTTVFVSPANKDAVALLPKEIQANPSIFPSDAQLSRFEMIQDLGDSVLLWDKAWTEVKASAQ